MYVLFNHTEFLINHPCSMSMSESTAKIVGGVISYKGYQNNDLLIAQNAGNTGKLSTM